MSPLARRAVRTPLSDGAPDPDRFAGIVRPYAQADVERLRGSIAIRHTLAELGAERLWHLLSTENYVAALGALTGNQAIQMARAGLQAIYLSGWQVAADANTAGQMYPDQSLYPVDSVPNVVRKINAALVRADQIERAEGRSDHDWFLPIMADAEAGFGGPLNAFELMKAMIEAGAAGVHFEDQLASEKKCGHMGGKVLVPTGQFIRTLTAARLAADVMGVSTLIVARTDAHSAKLLTSDVDERDSTLSLVGGANGRGLLPAERRPRLCHCSGDRLCAVRRRALVRDVDAGSRGGASIRRGGAREVPRQEARVQLLALFQLEEEARPGDDRQVPVRARAHGVQVSVRDAGGVPRAQLRDVRACAALQGTRDGRIFGAPGGRVCRRGGRVYGDAPPAGSGNGGISTR